MIGASLKKILDEYIIAKEKSFTGHKLASFIRKQAPQNLSPYVDGYITRGSAGQSQWAEVPWIAIFDPLVTNTARKGYYIVYLFSADMSSVSISMNQGATGTRKEFGGNARKVLQERSALIRSRIPEFSKTFSSQSIDLESEARFPLDYMAGHAFGKTYFSHELNEEKIVSDLEAMLRLYSALTHRGGIDTTSDQENDEVEHHLTSIKEVKQYRYHKRVERASTSKVKKIKGYVCEACSFDFEKVYGELGKEYIEAHHLKPLSSLKEGQAVSLDPQKDFAVLCANCHRMIHRQDDVSDLSALKARICAS